MTSSLSDSEDIVQDVLLNCADTDPVTIENPKSWLTKVCSNRALDFLKSAQKKREVYHGTWLPDAVPDSYQSLITPSESPDKNILLADSLTTSFLLLIDRLTPEERAVYLLSEVFEYSFKDIADLMDKSIEACRKIAERARKAIGSGRERKKVDMPAAEKLISQFFESARRGDNDSLISILAKESEFWADGGGKVSAAHGILRSAEQIARFWTGISRSPSLQGIDYKLEFLPVNGMPGAAVSKKLADGSYQFETILSFEIEDGKISRIFAQRNPDKFKALQ